MKTKLFTLILLLFCHSNINAGIVDLVTAKTVAINYYNQQKGITRPVSQQDFIQPIILSKDETVVLYIFNSPEDKGFIIVSGSNKAKPVLGFSPKGHIPADNLLWNPGFRLMMKQFEREILFVESGSLETDPDNFEHWQELIHGAPDLTATEVKLMLTSTWNQEGHYNDACPETGSNGHPCNGIIFFCGETPTGCGATAMGQILRYYRYPVTGKSENQYIDIVNKDNQGNVIDPTYGTQTVNFATSSYNWQNMPDDVSSSNSNVAALLYQCGVAQNMNYCYNESGSFPDTIVMGYENFFDYNTACTIVYRENEPLFEQKLISEIDKEHPVQFAGYGSAGGHTWVLMGYRVQTTGNQFWMNWGWGGNQDAWFALSALTPGNFNFSSNELAIINLYPNKQPDLQIPGLSINTAVGPSGGDITVTWQVKNAGAFASDTCTLQFYLSHSSGLTAGSVELQRIVLPQLNPGTTTPVTNTVITIPSNIPQGSYYLLSAVDRYHSVHESAENNNEKYVSFTVSSLGISIPNGGEVCSIGSSLGIKWQEHGNSTQFVKIELLKNGIPVKTITSSVESKPGDNTYNWNVDPGSGQQGVDFMLKITSQSNSQNYDLSDNNFIINKGGTTITFSGIKWQISNGRKTPGDGCNYWFDGFINGQNVYNLVSVDGSGNLHLKIKKIGNHWYCPELESLYHFGYGEYRYYVSSNLNYDPKVVAGLFSYESDTKEIDLEFHHWPTNIFCSDRQGNYIVQHPPNTCFHLNPYEVNWHKFEVPSNTQTTHKYTWSSGDVHFQSYLGHTPSLMNNPDLIDDWTTPCWESWIPAPGASHVMLNFWMTAAAPDNGATEMELVIAAVKIPQPDLVIENASVSQSPVVPGTPVFINYLLNNKGDGNAGTSVTRILYSRDNVVSSDDTELALETEGAVAPGAGILHYKQVVIPSSAIYGSRYLILIADKSNLVPEESNETNNTTVVPITVGAAYSTLTVNVFNVPGGSAALPGSNAYVSLIKPNGSSCGLPVRTNSNGVAVFTNVLNAASYKISVYYDPSPATIHGKEFWGEKTPVNIFANTTVDFTRNNPYESAPIKVFYSNNTPVTGPVPPGTVLKLKTVATNPNSASKTVKTRLVIDADLSTPYSIDQESSPKTVAPGQSLENEFTFMPTVGGNYYATVGTKMAVTSTSYTVTDGWAWPVNPTIIVVAPSSPLTVIVHNVPGGITTIPGINGVVKVLTASGSVVASQSTNSSHTAYFPSIPNGSNYTIRVYHNPATTLFGQEYWGGMTGITVNGSQTINFTRNQPYELEYLRFYKKDGTEVPAGSTIPTGTTLSVKAKVLNPNASPLPAKVRVVIDQNSYSPYDFDQESAQQQVIQPGQSATFAFTYTPTLTGSYYATVGVKSNSTGAMIISDGWEWPATAAFVVDGPSSALSVTVQNIDGTSVPIPGSHGSVDLIKSNGSTIASPTTNLNGIAFFQNVPTGNSYSIKTYHTPLNPTTIFGKEYWGGTGGINIPGTSAVTFQRNMPHGIDWVRVYDGNDEITGMTVPEGTYTVKFTVKNPNPQSQVVALNLVADHSRSAPYEFNSTTPSYTIPANGTRTFEVPLTFTVEHQGGYYIVSGTVTTVGGNATITDGWAWYSSPSIFIDPGCNSTSISPASLLVPTTSWQSVSYDHAGYFSKFYVTKGSAYTWSLCPADGATANFDSELTLRKADDDTLIVYNDANCSSGNNAKINWVATFTGTVKVITTQWRCATNSLPVVLKYKKTSKDEEDFPGPEDQLIKIYPNPTAGKQTIDLHEVLPSEVSYELVDMRGTTIHNYTVHREGLNDIIDLSSLPSGMYLLRIKAGDYLQLSKIVLQK